MISCRRLGSVSASLHEAAMRRHGVAQREAGLSALQENEVPPTVSALSNKSATSEACEPKEPQEPKEQRIRAGLASGLGDPSSSSGIGGHRSHRGQSTCPSGVLVTMGTWPHFCPNRN
eukprot:Skav219257  [mRNA]  locus=scaffold1242:399850:403439:+ [translate_table: standard]